MVRGHVDVLTFDEDGQVTARHAIGAGSSTFAYETPMRTWHTVVPGGDGGAFFEVKEGPYDPATAAEFAPWSPAEGAPGTDAYRAWLLRAQPGELYPR